MRRASQRAEPVFIWQKRSTGIKSYAEESYRFYLKQAVDRNDCKEIFFETGKEGGNFDLFAQLFLETDNLF